MYVQYLNIDIYIWYVNYLSKVSYLTNLQVLETWKLSEDFPPLLGETPKVYM